MWWLNNRSEGSRADKESPWAGKGLGAFAKRWSRSTHEGQRAVAQLLVDLVHCRGKEGKVNVFKRACDLHPCDFACSWFFCLTVCISVCGVGTTPRHDGGRVQAGESDQSDPSGPCRRFLPACTGVRRTAGNGRGEGESLTLPDSPEAQAKHERGLEVWVPAPSEPLGVWEHSPPIRQALGKAAACRHHSDPSTRITPDRCAPTRGRVGRPALSTPPDGVEVGRCISQTPLATGWGKG